MSYYVRPQDLHTVQHEEGGTVFLSTERPFADWVELVPAAKFEQLRLAADNLVGTWGTHLDRDQQALVDALTNLEKK